jgi:hypothetical protein
MQNDKLKNILPYIAAIAIFIAVTFVYFSPMLKGKVIVQSDLVSHKGMSKEIVDFRDKYNSEPLWTNSMFGGMPAYLISVKETGSLLPYISRAITLGMKSPASIMYSYMLGFFILLLVLRVNVWLSVIGAIAFALSSYNIIIIDAGHATKAMAISYMAPVLASVILIFRKKYLLGAALLSLSMGLELMASHVQITYYLILLLSIYSAFELIKLFKEKQHGDILKTLISIVAAAIISLGCNTASLLNTMDYVKYSIRGKSELTDNQSNKTSGLDRDYVVQWSIGKAETMSLMIPGFKGRSSGFVIGESKSALKDVEPSMKEIIGSNIPQYWGDQPFTSACYAGAIIIFLFVLGLFIVEGHLKWVLLLATILSIALAWGKHFMGLTDLFLDFVPGYNKFRAVSMILTIALFAIPLLAILCVDKLLKTQNLLVQNIKLAFINKNITVKDAIIYSFALTGGLSLLFYLVPDLTSFNTVSDGAIFNQIAQSNGQEVAQKFIYNIEVARKALFKSDALRSFIFIALAAAAIWIYAMNKISKTIILFALGILITIDLWQVDKGFLNDKNFTSKKEAQIPFPETAADAAILKDKDPNYRVLNMAVNTFNDASTSYRHKSVGGYHAAKLRRYQDLIERHISPEMSTIANTLQNNPSDSSLKSTLTANSVLNMLNTKYIIYNQSAEPLFNKYALGNAWFVKDVKFVKNADEEIASLTKLDVSSTALVDEQFKQIISKTTFIKDSTGTISLTDYKPNHLTYKSKTAQEQLVVFSEIYYDDGWKAYIDGENKPYFRTNYVLRGLVIPQGEHTIEFKFEPEKFYTRLNISLFSSILLLGFVGFSIFKSSTKKND